MLTLHAVSGIDPAYDEQAFNNAVISKTDILFKYILLSFFAWVAGALIATFTFIPKRFKCKTII